VERKMKDRGDESGENDQSFERSRTVRLTTANNTSPVCVRVYVCAGRKHRHGTYYHVPDCSRQIRDVLFRFSAHGSDRGTVENLVSLMADARAALKMFLICVARSRSSRIPGPAMPRTLIVMVWPKLCREREETLENATGSALPSFSVLCALRAIFLPSNNADFPNRLIETGRRGTTRDDLALPRLIMLQHLASQRTRVE